MKTQYRIIGHHAIRIAARDGVSLHKFSDPIDGARDVTATEAESIAREDSSLLYVDVHPAGWTGRPGDADGYNVADYFEGGNKGFNGPDEDGIEPIWVDA